jgi:hypothetical protein
VAPRPHGDSLDIAVALFDREGGYVAGTAEAVKFDLPGALTLHWDFPEIKTGTYIVRLVIREPDTQAITAINRTLLVR